MYKSTIVNPSSSSRDLDDAIHARLGEIRSLSFVSTGEDFAQWSDEIRWSYLNMIAIHASEVESLFNAYKALNEDPVR
jgi:hypothetical protein